jgi:hypothetical protein
MPRKIIAVDLDDTLNDFSATLRGIDFARDHASALSDETFENYMHRIRSNAPEPTDLLSTDYSYLRYRVHEQCYRQATARRDAIAFMQWLRQDGWQIVICTYRDLRRANTCTREWLGINGIPFDYLFMARNKIVFCKLWGIEHLVDDDEFNIVHGSRYGVKVFYPISERHNTMPPNDAAGFTSFEDVTRWIQK